MGIIDGRAPPAGRAHGIASNDPATGVSYEFPIPYPAPHDRPDSFLSFVDHAVWAEETPGGKIVLNGEAGHSASR